jgi:hypothetical protein
MKKVVFFAIFCSIVLFSCGMKKKYYYVEDTKDEKLIEASSDSAAYVEAYTTFQISKTIHKQMKAEYSSFSRSEPIDFTLFDENHKQIFPSFYQKDSIEKAIEKEINSMPNNVADGAQKYREKENGKGAKYDTGGLYLAPIKVLSARFVVREYSNYKDVSLRFKNVSNKRVSAIRFKWYCENAFNEPADAGNSILKGWGAGFTDSELGIGTTTYGTWEILSKDGKKILIAYPYEVAFTDGTKWELKK